jgi:hypothetical protein
MKEHPILFSTPMVQAILEGRKTQTRRIIKSFNKRQCPYGEPGDVLWVRETWAPALGDIAYRADYTNEVLEEKRNKGIWHPSIHMTKAAARIWLQITEVRVEKLEFYSIKDTKTGRTMHIKPPGNPWVWVINFKVVSTTGKQNIHSNSHAFTHSSIHAL